MKDMADIIGANAILSLYGLQLKYDNRDWYVAQAGTRAFTPNMWTRMYVDGGADDAVTEILYNLEDVYVYVGIKQLP